MIEILAARGRHEQPWKNGGGVTRPVASAQGGRREFGWRVSLADVTAAGAFSCFPGISRLMGILEGRLELRVDGLGTVELAPGGPAYAFPGDAPAYGTPLRGPVRDINLMFDPECFTGLLEYHGTDTEEHASVSTRLLLALAPLSLNGQALEPLDAALIAPGMGFVAAGGPFWLARLTPER